VGTDISTPKLVEFLRRQHFSALARLDYFQSSRTLDDRENLAGASLQLKALPRLTDHLDGKIEARLIDSDVGYAADRGRSRLLEAYATAHFAKADLRVGKQIVAWGRADGINPTDNLTPRDFAVLLPFDEDQRFGTTALKLDTYLSEVLTLTVFVTPLFEPSEFPLPPVSGITEKRPTRKLSDSEGALKLNKTGDSLDWSFSYYHGHSLLPTLRPQPQGIELDYDHVDVIGADVARNFGRYGLRSEIAYTRPANQVGADPNPHNSRVFWVIGLDRTLLENLNINVQLFTHWMPQYRDPAAVTAPLERNIAVENAVILGQEARVSNGFTLRVSDKWLNETLQAELFAAGNFKQGDRYLRPLVTYAFNDRLKGTLGGELYRGASNTPYGLFRPSSGVFVELRYGL